MSFLSYKVLRSTCLRFPEQLEVVVTGDVLQKWLPARSVTLAMILAMARESRQTFITIVQGVWCFGYVIFLHTYNVFFLLFLIESTVPLPPQFSHLLLVAQLTLCRSLRSQRKKLRQNLKQNKNMRDHNVKRLLQVSRRDLLYTETTCVLTRFAFWLTNLAIS